MSNSLKVIVDNPGNEDSFNKALALFKRKCNRDGFLKEIRDRKYYNKPSEIKHEKDKQMKRKKLLK